MKRAQSLAIGGKPYSQLADNVIRQIAAKIDRTLHPLLYRSGGEKKAVIFFSTDKGLAGPINSNLYREVSNISGGLRFISVGKKARNFVVRTGRELLADFPLVEKPDVPAIRPIAKFAIDGFLQKEFDQVVILYTRFKSTLKQTAVVEPLLPILDAETLESLTVQSKEELLEPLFEPSPDSVLANILPHFVLMQLYQTLLEAKASEHSATMVAMKNATENAQDLSDDLKLTYNGIRQDNITKEILDITTSALALE